MIMEVLPCSGVQYVGEAENGQQNSGMTSVPGNSNGFSHEQQVQMRDGGVVDLFPNMEDSLIKGQELTVRMPLSEERIGEASSMNCQDDAPDLEDYGFNLQNSAAPENSHLIVDNIECEPSSCKDRDSSFSVLKWLENDESIAVWVKWRGIWQAGIKCARADWPLSTLRAKPTHDRKKYLVVFFPRTRNYSWADALLVRSIYEFPHPIAYKTHKVGWKMVKDLNVARRNIMQKLVVSMLNIVDQFHTEALVESARDVITWKQFAMEASHCSGYSALGEMLLKLQKMILQPYINADWMQHSFQSWAERCQAVQNAETVELLKEELFDSILWNDVNALRDARAQATIVSEWRTWKSEVTKWFSTSHPMSSNGESQQKSCEISPNMNLQVSRKRPKLEVRRAEAHVPQVEVSSPHQAMTIEIDSGFFGHQDTAKHVILGSEPFKDEDRRDEALSIVPTCNIANRWDEIVVEGGNPEPTNTKDVLTTPGSENMIKTNVNAIHNNKQCIAFIESKGRQCVRWANDGDVYCCVHLASRFLGSSTGVRASPPVQSPLCCGTTVLGTQCKHRSLPGSSFCKKHRPRTDLNLNSAESPLKRKHEETIPSWQNSCRDIVPVEGVGSSIQLEPVSITDGGTFNGRNLSINKSENFIQDRNTGSVVHCMGSNPLDNGVPCHESPKRYSLYCDKHIPSWLKRARNGKSRIIPKDLFIDLLVGCNSLEKKLQLHQACELFYKLFKSILSLRNPVPMEVQFQWALSEASKDRNVGEFLLTLVSKEKERLRNMWGLRADEDLQISSTAMGDTEVLPLAIESGFDNRKPNCKFCSKEFADDQELSKHCMDNHKKEASWYFRGYACAICLDSFTNKKLLETHVQERHHVQFVEQCMLLQCIPCKSNFGNTEQLWSHVLSVHPSEFKLSNSVAYQQGHFPADNKQSTLYKADDRERNQQKDEPTDAVPKGSNDENLVDKAIRKLVCRFCGLKFDLLPDLGRHHQAAHMGPNNLLTSNPSRKGIHYYAYKLKSGRLGRPRFKKGRGAASYRMRNSVSAKIKKRIQMSKLVSAPRQQVQSHENDAGILGKLDGSEYAALASILFSKIQKAKPQPNNHDILAAAHSACCKVSLKATLEGKYGVLPERVYLKAAKLCSEHNILVEWHKEGFICPRGCKSFRDPWLLQPLVRPESGLPRNEYVRSSNQASDEWEVDECHFVIDKNDLRDGPKQKLTILCDDISFGKESMPVACVVEEDVLDSCPDLPIGCDGQSTKFPMPWESFTYITRPMLDQSHGSDIESLQLGCACQDSVCSPEVCDHVYLFDTDYEDAKDIYGKPMRRRFPYDDKGRIVLEEGYLVYECSHLCRCDKTCPNRVLQNGVGVKLELFKTRNKGWAIRAVEPILRGSFVCEYIGEVIDEQEAAKRRTRSGEEGWGYMYKIDAHSNDMSRLVEGEAQYVIDATKYGNVSRFINHSCSPNLVNRQVLVESMDSQRAHIGLYASQDISSGEELTYDYRYELLPGKENRCHCGVSKCRGRLF